MISEIVPTTPGLHNSRTEEGNVIHGTVVAKQRCRDFDEILVSTVRSQGNEHQLLAAVVGPPRLRTSRTEQRNVIHCTIHAKQRCRDVGCRKQPVFNHGFLITQIILNNFVLCCIVSIFRYCYALSGIVNNIVKDWFADEAKRGPALCARLVSLCSWEGQTPVCMSVLVCSLYTHQQIRRLQF
jgi:hypothetical protein